MSAIDWHKWRNMEVVPLGQASALVAGISPDLLRWTKGHPAVFWPTAEATQRALPGEQVSYSDWQSGTASALAECNTAFRRVYDVALSSVRNRSLRIASDATDPFVSLPEFVRWAKKKRFNVPQDLWYADFDPTVDWAFWKRADTAKVIECAALCVRVNPEVFVLDRTPSLIGDWRDCILQSRVDIPEAAMSEFTRIVELAGRAIKGGTLKPCDGAWNNPERVLRTQFIEVPMPAFLQWAAEKEISVPAELRGKERSTQRPPSALPVSGRAHGWVEIGAYLKKRFNLSKDVDARTAREWLRKSEVTPHRDDGRVWVEHSALDAVKLPASQR